MYLFPITPEEVLKTINEMELKAGGVDGINVRTIKYLTEFLVNPLIHIINISIAKATWPDSPKCAEIKLIP